MSAIKHRKKSPKRFVTASLSFDEDLLAKAREHAKSLDSDLSKYLRGLARRDLEEAGVLPKSKAA